MEVWKKNKKHKSYIGHTKISRISVEHCPTEDMQADFLTKPLQGETFKKMFKWLMGIE